MMSKQKRRRQSSSLQRWKDLLEYINKSTDPVLKGKYDGPHSSGGTKLDFIKAEIERLNNKLSGKQNLPIAQS
jgi:hypothetical protein